MWIIWWLKHDIYSLQSYISGHIFVLNWGAYFGYAYFLVQGYSTVLLCQTCDFCVRKIPRMLTSEVYFFFNTRRFCYFPFRLRVRYLSPYPTPKWTNSFSHILAREYVPTCICLLDFCKVGIYTFLYQPTIDLSLQTTSLPRNQLLCNSLEQFDRSIAYCTTIVRVSHQLRPIALLALKIGGIPCQSNVNFTFTETSHRISKLKLRASTFNPRRT